MSLRLRLALGIGLALTVLWVAAALWMLRDLDHSLQRTLDDRLAMSTRMVSGLIEQSLTLQEGGNLAIDQAVTVPGNRSMACQVRSLRGQVIATTRGAAGLPLDGSTPGYDTRLADGTYWRTYTLQTDHFSITTADRMDERDELRKNIALAAGLPFLIAAVGGLLALWFGVGRGLAPLERLRRTVAAREPDAVTPLDAGPLPSELQPLTDALNHHLRHTAEAMQRERHFTNDAAHELRTPLTAIDTHLQVARITSGETHEQALEDAEEGVHRMRSTLEQLLLLARVEGRVSFDQSEAIDANQVLDHAIADGTEGAAKRIVRRAEGAGVMVAIPPALAVTALRNLTDNAVRYSSPDTAVEVVIDTAPGSVIFTVIDHGPGLGPDATRVKERFWRGGNTGAGTGSGLGLTIVEAIACRYGGSLDLSPGRDGGTRARLTLPRPSMQA
ncbi:ATP-binding protein [Lysobacter sp. A289]